MWDNASSAKEMSPTVINQNSGGSRGRRFLPLGILLALLCCSKAHEGPTDGETHFLRVCSPESDDCGSDLACLCGVCALPCSKDAACQRLNESAQCIFADDRPAAAACADPPSKAFCDVPCTTDDDCSGLASPSFCHNGFCRSIADFGAGGGSSATATAGGAGGNGSPGGAGDSGGPVGGSGGVGGSAGAEPCPRGEVAADEVVVLGDVFLADHQITTNLEGLARNAEALGSDESYRDYSSSTENVLSIGNSLLKNRYAAAQAESPVKVVIMDAGGPDLLMGSCGTTPTPDCQLMVDVVAAAEELLAQMADDGVEHVVWFYYPDPSDEALRAKVQTLRPLAQEICESSTVQNAMPCHWLDLRDTFNVDDHYDEYMQTDFVATEAGARAAASAIWSAMESDCVAQ